MDENTLKLVAVDTETGEPADWAGLVRSVFDVGPSGAAAWERFEVSIERADSADQELSDG